MREPVARGQQPRAQPIAPGAVARGLQLGAAIGVMARAPSSGGKTRLAPFLAAPRLESLRRALLADTLQSIAAFPDIATVVFVTPADGGPEVAALADRPVAAVSQAEGDLGDRMRSAVHHLLVDRGHAAALLIGTDMPLLTAGHIADALGALRSTGSVVLGPADDGGYYLIGMTEVHAGVFEGIGWGGPTVLADTMRAASHLGLSAQLIRRGYDVDTVQDLGRLARDLSDLPLETAPNIRRWFSEGP